MKADFITKNAEEWTNLWSVGFQEDGGGPLFWNVSSVGGSDELNYETLREYIVGSNDNGPVDGEPQPELLPMYNPISGWATPEQVYSNLVSKFNKIIITFTNETTTTKKNTNTRRTDFTHIDPTIKEIDDDGGIKTYETSISSNSDRPYFIINPTDNSITNNVMVQDINMKLGHKFTDTFKYPDEITLSVAPILVPTTASLYFYFTSDTVIKLQVKSGCETDNTLSSGFFADQKYMCDINIPLFQKFDTTGREFTDQLMSIGVVSARLKYDPNISVVFKKLNTPKGITYEYKTEEGNTRLIEQIQNLLNTPDAESNSEFIMLDPISGPKFKGEEIFEIKKVRVGGNLIDKWFVTRSLDIDIAKIVALQTVNHGSGSTSSVFDYPIEKSLLNIVEARIDTIKNNLKQIILKNCPTANEDGTYEVSIADSDGAPIDGIIKLAHNRSGLDPIRESENPSFDNANDSDLIHGYANAGLIISNNVEYTNGK
jgi:hypothetical protein